MSFITKLNYLFRKHPLLRVIILLTLVLTLFSVFVYVLSLEDSEPIIIDIYPAVGEAGDVMTITGEHFGRKTAGSSVIIGGIRITTSSYLDWTDTMIKIVLPFNISDGLVYVETRQGRSSPSVFANKKSVPVPIVRDVQTTFPVVDKIRVTNNTIGGIVTIEGSNFGTIRENSQVLFTTADSSSANRKGLVACSPFDKDYQFWTDTQIKVRIPEGAISGNVYVKTNNGTSEGHNLTVFQNIGKKLLGTKRTYVLDVTADITDFQADEHATLTLFMPKPITSSSQNEVITLSSEPKPESEFLNTFVQHISQEDVVSHKNVFEHSFSLDVYSVETNIKENSVRQYSNEVLTYYSDYLQSDLIVPSDNEDLQTLASEIVGNVKNPYTKARLLYEWVLENIEITSILQVADSDITTILNSKKADAYEITILYAALLRVSGIPSIPNAGVLLDSNLVTKNHWWVEFYVEGIGWVPVDVALASGLEYDAFQPILDKEEYYFGNLDGQHIAFSRGLNNLGQTQINGTKVYRPKTYALQSIWEESTEGVKKYSSYWQNASVLGVY